MDQIEPTEAVNDGPVMQEAALKKLVRDLSNAFEKIEHVETHLVSCMDQFKHMADRFHDNIKHISRVQARLENVEQVLAGFESRVESIAPQRRHCLNPTCRRLLNERDRKCGHCGEQQLGGT